MISLTENIKIRNIYGVLESKKISDNRKIEEFRLAIKLNKEPLNTSGTYIKVLVFDNNINAIVSRELVLANIGAIDYEFTPAQEKQIAEDINEYLIKRII